MEKIRPSRSQVSVCFVMVLMIVMFMTTGANSTEPTPEEFYKGKTITFIVPYPPGGSFDLTGRVIGPYLQKHTGAAAVVIKNVTGGGGVTGTNHNYTSKPDGLRIGCFPVGVVTAQMFGAPGIKYDMRKFSYVGGAMEMPLVVSVSTTGRFKSLNDLRVGKGVKFGQDNVAGHWSMGAFTTIELLKLDAKVITGFRGGAPIKMALDKGEVDVASTGLAMASVYMQQGAVKPLILLGIKERFPSLPDVPTLREVVATSKLTPEDKQLLDIWDNLPSIFIVAAPPGIPKDRLAFLQNAFKKTIAEPVVIKDFEKMMRSSVIISRTPNELKERYSALLERKAELSALYKEIFKRYTPSL
jgi:tripartite-type tricarboxylate transporter receptor subunit TctC